MIRSVIAATLFFLATASGAVLHEVERGSAIPGQYIIRLAKGNDRTMLRNHVNKVKAFLGADMTTMFVYESLASYGVASYAAKLTDKALAYIMEQDAVAYVEPDQVMSINDCKAQTNPDWGTVRTNIRGSYSKSTDYDYFYTTGKSGAGVDAYIIDTGIYCENNEFVNKITGTCTYGTDTIDGSNVDGNGHGTHCAGSVAGITYGVAKEANLIAVRVLNDAGSGSTSGIVEGINWMIAAAATTGRPSIANLSLGGSYSQALNDATKAAVDADITMLVAAGNSNKNACNYSPASEPSAVTVGATDNADYRASYSNYGVCVDIFGPGSDITSAWIGSPNAINTISGTSMATPNVAGVAAKYLSANPSMTAAQVAQKLVNDATKDVLKNVDGGFFPNADNKSPNLMTYGYCS